MLSTYIQSRLFIPILSSTSFSPISRSVITLSDMNLRLGVIDMRMGCEL